MDQYAVYLSILVVETMAEAFRENRKNRSIAVNSAEINMEMMQQESLKLLDSFGGHLAQTQQ